VGGPTGGPFVSVQLLDRAIQQLKGKMRFDWQAEGLACDIEIEA